MNTRNLFFILVSVLFLVYCSSPKESQKGAEAAKEKTIKTIEPPAPLIKTDKVYCWLNEMPNSETRFNITGEIYFTGEKEYSLDNITILQEGKILYRISPKTRNIDDPEIRGFIFSTIKGLFPVPVHKIDQPVDVEFNFSYGKKKYLFRLKNQIVEKVI